MFRRIIAWFAILGFVFLIANLLVFHIMPTLSAMVYGLILVLFFITGKENHTAEKEKSLEDASKK